MERDRTSSAPTTNVCMGAPAGFAAGLSTTWTLRLVLWARPMAVATFAALEAVHVLAIVSVNVPAAGPALPMTILAAAGVLLTLPLAGVALLAAIVSGARRADRTVVRLSASDQQRIVLGALLFAYALYAFFTLASSGMPLSPPGRALIFDPEARRLAVLGQLRFVTGQMMVYVGWSALYLTRGTRRQVTERLQHRSPAAPVADEEVKVMAGR